MSGAGPKVLLEDGREAGLKTAGEGTNELGGSIGADLGQL